ncbi:MAG TPA: hypothetical protein VHN82_05500, partial [Methanoregula sp.]|nr:hypothetical protein [Methanoregula sp.]
GSMAQARRFTNEQGAEIIAITAPIYNEETCSNSSCHFHDPQQKVLGTLDIGVSASHLNHTLFLMRNRMIMFTVMVLLLTIVGVVAYLQRNVFMPLREIKEFTSRVNRGRLAGKLTGISGELEELAGDVQSLAFRLEKTEQKLEELQSDIKQNLATSETN